MKSILLKLDDELFAKAEVIAKESNISRNKLIRNAIEAYTKALNKLKFERQLRKEVMMLQDGETDLDLIEELNSASLEDLQKYIDEIS